ncbi:MAG: hypothetical protein HY078_09680 [Elusimicrobia bacterium]|nr:hypothetical protein [Elusimicrobiota bacterium]
MWNSATLKLGLVSASSVALASLAPVGPRPAAEWTPSLAARAPIADTTVPSGASLTLSPAKFGPAPAAPPKLAPAPAVPVSPPVRVPRRVVPPTIEEAPPRAPVETRTEADETAAEEALYQNLRRSFARVYSPDSRGNLRRVMPRPKGHVGPYVVSSEFYRNPAAPLGERNVSVTNYSDGSKVVRLASPLVFDLSGQGLKTKARRTVFDIKGNGTPFVVDDLADHVGLLVFDPQGRGVSGESGLALFGDRTDLDGSGTPDGFHDGFDALRAFAERAAAAGVIGRAAVDRRRLDARDLEKLEAAYGLRMKVGGLHGRTLSLREAGVDSIDLPGRTPEHVPNFDGRGNDITLQDGALFRRADGSLGTYADLWFRCAPAPLAGRTLGPAASAGAPAR